MQIALALSLTFAATACAVGRSAAGSKPHVIFTMVDDLGWNGFNFASSGNKEVISPTINKLAAEGVILTNHYTVSHNSSCDERPAYGFLSRITPQLPCVYTHETAHPPPFPAPALTFHFIRSFAMVLAPHFVYVVLLAAGRDGCRSRMCSR